MSNTQYALEVDQLGLSIGGRELLKGISFKVKPGEVVAVLGPNGAGKSTLFRAISGELAHQSGEIRFNGRRRADYERPQLAKQLGILPQSSSLSFPFRVLEVVTLGLINHGGSALQQQQIAFEMLERVDALHLAERTYTVLSGGEKQRVHLARVLAQISVAPESGYRSLLLDEPTSALDLAHQHRTLREVRRCAEEAMGCLVILHDLNLAARYADRILILADGQLLADGDPWQVLTPERLEATYGVPLQVLPHPDGQSPLIVS